MARAQFLDDFDVVEVTRFARAVVQMNRTIASLAERRKEGSISSAQVLILRR